MLSQIGDAGQQQLYRVIDHPQGLVAVAAQESTDLAGAVVELELLQGATMPARYNRPEPKTNTLAEIWDNAELNAVRKSHVSGLLETVAVCAKCTFRDTFKWEKL